MNESMMMISVALLVLFAHLSIFDGLYFHLWKYKLQERVDSKFEHLTHTARALLFIPTVFLIYYYGLSGIWIWTALVILGLDLVAEVLDVLSERASRETIGGLSSGEYLLHVMLTTVRVAALSLAFAALPRSAWDFGSQVAFETPNFSRYAAISLLPAAALVAGLHLYLIGDPTLVSRLQARLRFKCCGLQNGW